MSHTEDKEIPEQASFEFLGNKYSLKQTYFASGAAPVMALRTSELSDVENQIDQLQDCNENDFEQGAIAVYRFEGKYHVILGYQKFKQLIDNSGTIKVKLITKHALKKCLFDENPERTRSILNEQIYDRNDGYDRYPRNGRQNPNENRSGSFNRKDRGEFGNVGRESYDSRPRRPISTNRDRNQY